MKQKVLEAIGIHRKLLEQLEAEHIDTIIQAGEMIVASLKAGGCVYLCGNGGSAADCQHIAGELIGRFRRERKGLPAVALSTDTSVITCVANDYSFEDIFSRQVEALVNTGDVLWAFSTSGESANVLKAVELAKDKRVKVLAFTGKADSALEKTSDLCICVDSPQTCFAQEIHQLAYHIICDIVESLAYDS